MNAAKCHISPGSALFDKIKQSSGAKGQGHLNLEILTCIPLICIMSYSRLVVSNQMDEFISIHEVNKDVKENYQVF